MDKRDKIDTMDNNPRRDAINRVSLLGKNYYQPKTNLDITINNQPLTINKRLFSNYD